MDEKELQQMEPETEETLEFNLDDIMKEFASEPGEVIPELEDEEPEKEETAADTTDSAEAADPVAEPDDAAAEE